MPQFAVIADDLSGAVETAAVFLLRTTRIAVTLGNHTEALRSDADVVVIDTDTRQLPGPVAAESAALAIAAVEDIPVTIKKIDSLLRGNVAAELMAARSLRPNMVVATALPAALRTVRNGRLQLAGQPLGHTDAWRAEAGEQPETVAHALAPLPTTSVSLEQVRSGDLVARFRSILAGGSIPVCDSDDDDDLDRIAAAATQLEHPLLVGSAGLAGAVARAASFPAAPPVTPRPASAGRILVVVGSAASGSAVQLDQLAAADPLQLLLEPGDILDAATRWVLIARIDGALAANPDRPAVIAVRPGVAVDHDRARDLVQALADIVVEAARAADCLVLTGGETARAVLDRLGASELTPISQIHHGAVICAGPGGQLIATRPGSFGGPDSLLAIVRALQDARTPLTKEPA